MRRERAVCPIDLAVVERRPDAPALEIIGNQQARRRRKSKSMSTRRNAAVADLPTLDEKGSESLSGDRLHLGMAAGFKSESRPDFEFAEKYK
jgi:hypothetical protein